MTTRAWTWLLPAWLFNRRVGVGLLWVVLVIGVAVGANVAGIHIIGSIDGWQHWLAAHRGYFFVWRLLLYAATGYGWWWMRRRLREREPSVEARQRLLRVEVAALITLVLLEGSHWLQAR
ncbi:MULTISPECIES: hypothetical protein [Burkholderiaceae]|uniref:Transmembrane protein n=1 Tax=Burkholderia cepacia TaxID=292 RepID=A0A8I1AIH4_BURCE|nr:MULTISPECIES: hypothetical protein [Burkholderiaceae]MBB0025235.1 hypothetical protein [Ralstonia pickettii]MBB0036023.1 hypothetical protein [Ralstonia pickettii]MBB0098563.1 hypothetical protein [Ralstonia pickettii]MBB0108378.1 hypothetical protein [Ralstonia pickettii]MBB0129337.1 hypothetical protein [Ralstonia pickettii]